MKFNTLAVVLLLAPLAAIPNASAAVTTTVESTADPITTGLEFQLTYTKSSEVGDGQQTGSVALTYSGPESGTLLTKNYDVAETVDAVLTWNLVFVWTPGEYTFTFDDSVTSGTEVDDVLVLDAVPAFDLDWSVQITEEAGYDALRASTQSLAVDPNGNAYIAYSARHTGEANGYDGFVKSYARSGNLRWTQAGMTSPNTDYMISGIVWDNGGRIMTLECFESGGVVGLVQTGIINPSNGFTTQGAIISETAPFAVTNCASFPMSAIADGDNDVRLYINWQSLNRVTAHDTEGVIDYTVTRTFPTFIAAETDEDRALMIRGSAPNIRVEAFNQVDGSEDDATGSLTSERAMIPFANPFVEHQFISIGRHISACKIYPDIDAATPGALGGLGVLDANTCQAVLIGDNTQSDDYGLENSVMGADLDGSNRPLICAAWRNAEDTDNYHPFITSYLLDGTLNGGLDVTSAEPGLLGDSSTQRSCIGIKADPLGGFYVLWDDRSVNTPTGTDNLYLMHYGLNPNGDAILSPANVPTQAAATVPGGGGGGGGGATGEGFFRNLQDYFNQGWGTEDDVSGWILFAVLLLGGLIIVAQWTRHTLILTLAAAAIVLVAWAIGWFPDWALLLIVFAIIAMAGKRLFGGGEDMEE